MTATEHTDATTTLAGIRQRARQMSLLANSVNGFEFNVTGALAELNADGTWKYWDAQSPYSLEAREFIASAPHAICQLGKDVDFLLDHVAALQRQLADAQARERVAVEALDGAIYTLTAIGNVDYPYEEMPRVAKRAVALLTITTQPQETSHE